LWSVPFLPAAVLASLDKPPYRPYFTRNRRKGGEGGMKLGKEALAKEAAFWGQIKKVDPRKVCHK